MDGAGVCLCVRVWLCAVGDWLLPEDCCSVFMYLALLRLFRGNK